MGGLWGAMLARSEAEIAAAYPELGKAYERPSWMTEQRYEQICRDELHDIDDEPSGIVVALLAERAKDWTPKRVVSELARRCCFGAHA